MRRKEMAMIGNILHAVQVLQNSGELGATDAGNLNIIVPWQDSNGVIDKQAVIDASFSNSEDPDGA